MCGRDVPCLGFYTGALLVDVSLNPHHMLFFIAWCRWNTEFVLICNLVQNFHWINMTILKSNLLPRRIPAQAYDSPVS